MIGTRKLWALVAVVAIVAAIFVTWKFAPKNKPFDPSVDLRTLSAEQLQDYWKNLDELYSKDTYGGKTPEETLQLFIDALKKGDTDLAAKYFVPEKQKKETGDLIISKNKNLLGWYLNIITGKQKGSVLEKDSKYEILFFDKNDSQIHIGIFVFNPRTNIWKITDL